MKNEELAKIIQDSQQKTCELMDELRERANLRTERDRYRERITELEALLLDIAPSWLPEGIRARRRELLKKAGRHLAPNAADPKPNKE